jgi:hypothetical protein
MKIKIQMVGQEDAFQRYLVKNVLNALKELCCACELDVVLDLKEILEIEKQNILTTPALIINGHILYEGHIWDKDHIKHFLEEAAKGNAG